MGALGLLPKPEGGRPRKHANNWQVSFGKQVSALTGKSRQTIDSCVQIGESLTAKALLDEERPPTRVSGVDRRVELSRRRDSLSFGHHAEIASLEPDGHERRLGELLNGIVHPGGDRQSIVVSDDNGNLPPGVSRDLSSNAQALKLEPLIAREAKEHQKAGGGSGPSGRQKSDKPKDTKKELAALAGVSHDTIAKTKLILLGRALSTVYLWLPRRGEENISNSEAGNAYNPDLRPLPCPSPVLPPGEGTTRHTRVPG